MNDESLNDPYGKSKELLNKAWKNKDIDEFKRVLLIIAKMQGIDDVIEKTGMSKAGLYKSLSKKGNPTLTTLFNIIDVLNISVSFSK